MSNRKKIFIVAGEPSGDAHAARLIKELKNIYPNAFFTGIGGDAMRKEGLNSIFDIEKMSVVGIWEVARKFKFFRDILNLCKEKLQSENFDIFIPVDYPGFNIRLAHFSRKIGIPVIYYIAPQLWAWGAKRAEKLVNAVDKLLVVFPFEKDFFANIGINTDFVGHPILDDPFYMNLHKSYYEREKLIAFLPGSRKQEIQKHLNLINFVARIVIDRFPDYRIAFAKPKALNSEYYNVLMKQKNTWEVFEDSRELMSLATTGIVKTGTSTLEAALCGMPFTMFYKTSIISYEIGKKLINLPYISLPNILLKKPLVKELIQKDANPNNISSEVIRLLTDTNYYENQQSEFRILKSMLGNRGASKRAATIISNFLEQK